MLTIKENTTNELIINKSKFITKLYKVNDETEIDKLITDLKKEYKDATHYCYAFVINNIQKANDDGEPSGTAGLPILNVLKQNNLDNILCVVIRYFGGIKLGSGGLIRAYTKATTEALGKSSLIDIKNGKLITITFSYDTIKAIEYLLKDITIVNKNFSDNVVYQIHIDNDCFNKIKKQLLNSCFSLIIEKEITL